MSWHYEDRRSSGMLRHPSDGEAWKHFDWEHADFVVNMQNVRLGLSTDGFNPYIQASFSPYSCWPIIVTSYNLPPEMCMTKPYMFLSYVVPGPFNPTVGIDVYLQPLIDDLKKLWSSVMTYDVLRKQNFMMKAALMWTINDFPPYWMLSNWGTHGRLACPYCMENTKAFQLANGGKLLGLTVIVGSYLLIMHLGGTQMPSKMGSRKGLAITYVNTYISIA